MKGDFPATQYEDTAMLPLSLFFFSLAGTFGSLALPVHKSMHVQRSSSHTLCKASRPSLVHHVTGWTHERGAAGSKC